ncbi:MAG: glycosyl transferase [Betaproteobacteria bacterium]|nr:MAG: glycosyl transferase [Betaproteobacteria bacterium]
MTIQTQATSARSNAAAAGFSLHSLSIIVPVYQDTAALTALLSQLAMARQQGVEVIVVGTAVDTSAAEVSGELADRYVVSEKGRGTQLAAGASASARPLIWFVHADSGLPDNAATLVVAALRAHRWGRFDIQIDDTRWLLRCVSFVMNVRSRWNSIATGDQGIFIRRELYDAVGGFPLIPLMEDIALCRALKRSGVAGVPACLRQTIVTSARKWQRDGVLKTVINMTRWRFRFWMGTSPDVLKKEYYRD